MRRKRDRERERERERERDQKNRYVMGEHEWRIITCGHTRIQEDAKLSFCGA